METTTEQVGVKAACKRCAEMVYFVFENGKLVARNLIDGDVHPCTNP